MRIATKITPKNTVLTQDCNPSGVGSHNFEITGYLKGQTMENVNETMNIDNIENIIKGAKYDNAVFDVSLAIKNEENPTDDVTNALAEKQNATDITLMRYQDAAQAGHTPAMVWQGVCQARGWPFQSWDADKGASINNKAPIELTDNAKKRLNSASATKSLIVKAMINDPEDWVYLESMKALKASIKPAPKSATEKAWKAWDALTSQERDDMLQTIVDQRGLTTVSEAIAKAA